MAEESSRENHVTLYTNFLYMYMIISIADGEHSAVEMDTIQACLKEWWETDNHSDPSIIVEASERAAEWVRELPVSNERLVAAALTLRVVAIGQREAFLNDLVRIAQADGSVHDNEKLYCNLLADTWGLAKPFDE